MTRANLTICCYPFRIRGYGSSTASVIRPYEQSFLWPQSWLRGYRFIPPTCTYGRLLLLFLLLSQAFLALLIAHPTAFVQRNGTWRRVKFSVPLRSGNQMRRFNMRKEPLALRIRGFLHKEYAVGCFCLDFLPLWLSSTSLTVIRS